MRISKKEALRLARLEADLRCSYDGADYSIEQRDDAMEEDGTVESWKNSPASMLATLMYDNYFCTREEVVKMRRKFGVKLWNAAMVCLVIGDHDT